MLSSQSGHPIVLCFITKLQENIVKKPEIQLHKLNTKFSHLREYSKLQRETLQLCTSIYECRESYLAKTFYRMS